MDGLVSDTLLGPPAGGPVDRPRQGNQLFNVNQHKPVM